MSLVRFRSEAPQYADVAHLVERHLAKVEVAGSSPVIRSKKQSTENSVLCFLEQLNPPFVRDKSALQVKSLCGEIRLRRDTLRI